MRGSTFSRCILLQAISIPPMAMAKESRDVSTIRTQGLTEGKRVTADVDVRSQSFLETTIVMNHPHVVVNPEKTTLEFSGLKLQSIIAAMSPSRGNPPPNETVTFIGRDGYAVSIPLDDALKADAIIIGAQGKTRLDWKKGAPSLAFPGLTKVPYLADQSWWTWWVSAIVISSPERRLLYRGVELPPRKLDKACSDTFEGTLQYPRGRRRNEPPRDTRGTLMGCSLKALHEASVPAGKARAPRILRVETLTGQGRSLGPAERFRLVRGFNGKPIPVELGGPLHVCDTLGKQECTYFVTGIAEGE